MIPNGISNRGTCLLPLLAGIVGATSAFGAQKTSGAEETPVHIAIAGGGFYSQTNAAGWFAGMLDVWPEQDLAEPLVNVRALSGISGGSWFLTQIGYSENFVDALQNRRDEWTEPAGYLGDVRSKFEGFEAFDCSSLPGSDLQNLCETVAILNPVFSVLQSAGNLLDPRWQEVCEEITFSQYGMKNELQGVRMSDIDSRPAWAREKDFIFTTVAGGWDDVLCNRYVFPFSLRNQYVRSNDATDNQPFKVPVLWSGVAEGRTPSDVLPGGDLQLTYYEQDMSPGNGTTISIDRNAPSDITVLGATAASSAAGGIASSYEFYRRTLGFSQQISNTLSNFLRNLSVPLRMTDNGFRTRANIPSDNFQNLADEQYMRISDGGINESTSVAALMHHMLRNDELDDFEIMLLDPQFTPLISCGKNQLPLPRSLAFLFGYSVDAPFLCLELGGVPGPVVCLENDPCGDSVPTSQIQVFEASDWPSEADVAWAWSGIDGPTGQLVELRILSIDVTTIANPEFDLPAGRNGTLHVFSGSTEYQDGIPLSGNNLDAYDALYRAIRRGLTDVDDDGGRLALFDALNTSPETTTCQGDLNGDGTVDGADLSTLLADWGGVEDDLNGDDLVDGADLAILLANWGVCE